MYMYVSIEFIIYTRRYTCIGHIMHLFDTSKTQERTDHLLLIWSGSTLCFFLPMIGFFFLTLYNRSVLIIQVHL